MVPYIHRMSEPSLVLWEIDYAHHCRRMPCCRRGLSGFHRRPAMALSRVSA